MQHRISKLFVSVDSVIFAYHNKKLFIPLFERKRRSRDEPFAGHWSLAGGPVFQEETLEEACRRKLEEDIGLEVEYLEQLYTFGAPDRDPRDRSISVSYFALIRWPCRKLRAGADVGDLRWFEFGSLPVGPYAFDHETIIQTAVDRLRAKVRYQPIGLNLMDDEFSIPDLKALYDVLLGGELDKRNFAKKLLSYGLLIPTRKAKGHVGRPTQLYRFDLDIYHELTRHGFSINA